MPHSNHILLQISAGAAAARCDDTAALKIGIVDYILEDHAASRSLGLERKGKKSDRGFNHHATASLLCPIKYEATQECVLAFTFHLLALLMLSRTFNKLKSGILPHGASLLPRFLFPENQVYDREDVEDGCFQGHLLLRASLFICLFIHVLLTATGASTGSKACSSRP